MLNRNPLRFQIFNVKSLGEWGIGRKKFACISRKVFIPAPAAAFSFLPILILRSTYIVISTHVTLVGSQYGRHNPKIPYVSRSMVRRKLVCLGCGSCFVLPLEFEVGPYPSSSVHSLEIDLDVPDSNIWGRFSASTRNQINRAMREGMIFQFWLQPRSNCPG